MSSYSAQQRWTVSQSDCDMWWKVDCIWQPDCIWPAQWLDWEEAPKHFLNSNFQQKMSWSLLVVCCRSDPLQLSESQQTHYIWEVCSENQWDALHWKLQSLQPALVNGKGPVLHDKAWPHNQCFKSWMNWAKSFASSAILTYPLTNWLPLLQASRQLFAGKRLPQPAGGRKCFPRFCRNLKVQIFRQQE